MRTADETEALLADEIETANAADFGDIDTFRFEEEKVLKAALDALKSGGWQTAIRWAQHASSRRPPQARFGFSWIRPGCRPGDSFMSPQVLDMRSSAPVRRLGARRLEAAVEAYVERGVAVDQAHRHMEQQRAVLLYPQLPEFEVLRERLDAMRYSGASGPMLGRETSTPSAAARVFCRPPRSSSALSSTRSSGPWPRGRHHGLFRHRRLSLRDG